LPVAPGSVQSGVPPLSAASVGQPLAALATDDETAGTLDDDVSVVVELHAASITANVAAQAARATEEGTREKFTVATLQPYCAGLAGGLGCLASQTGSRLPNRSHRLSAGLVKIALATRNLRARWIIRLDSSHMTS
jgi:hypothetical protein